MWDSSYSSGRSAATRARLYLLAAAVLFSTGGAAVKGTVLNVWQVAGGRSAIAAVVILCLVPATRRGWRWGYIPVAASYAATLILFVAATKLTTAANAIFIQGAAPFFVLLLSPVMLGERITRSGVLLMAVMACGLSLFFIAHESARSTAPDPARGNLMAAGSALTWALTLIGLRSVGRGASAESGAQLATVSLGNLMVGAATLPFALPLPPMRLQDTLVLLWLGLFQVALGYVCLTRGIRSVPAFDAVVLMMLEPVLNPLWAWMIHGEQPSPLSMAGGAIIIAAIVATAWRRDQRLVSGGY